MHKKVIRLALNTYNTLNPNTQLNICNIPNPGTSIWSIGQHYNEDLWPTASPLMCIVTSLFEGLNHGLRYGLYRTKEINTASMS